jgi:hypothetical protein
MKPSTSTHKSIQLAGRPRYWLPRDPAILRASIGRLVRRHEQIRSQTRTPVLG